MTMKRCRECETPVVFGKNIRWTKGGTITARDLADLRLFFIEIDELLNLLSYLGELLGVPVDHIIMESERPIGREMVEATLSPPLIRLVRSIPDAFQKFPFARGAFKRVADYARSMGYGSITMIAYEGRRRSLIRVRNPHSVPMIIGDCLGAFQLMLGVNMSVDWKRENGTILIEFLRTEEEPYDVPIPRAPYREGQVELPRCPSCGVPLMLRQYFEWDLVNGIITNRRTAYREAFLSVEGINAIFAEMEKELGEEVPLMVARRQADLTRERLGRRRLEEEGGVLAVFREMQLRGMGNPVEVEETGKQLKVRVENPFNDALVAGRIAGCYEALEGIKSKFSWVSSEEGYVVVGVEPAPGGSG
jgi:hypothetical protein